MRTYLFTFDLDKDGVISKADWVGMAIRFAQYENADKKKAEHLKTQFENVWKQFMKADTAHKEVLTVEVLSKAVGNQRYDPELMKHFTGLVEGLVDLMDLNNDGYLQGDEYERYLYQLGVQDPSYAREAIRTMDVNGDGKMSTDEFINAFWDFFFSDDEKSPNVFFFGPLVD
jgi:Ca2+-binding EF-hand superfamily protein